MASGTWKVCELLDVDTLLALFLQTNQKGGE